MLKSVESPTRHIRIDLSSLARRPLLHPKKKTLQDSARKITPTHYSPNHSRLPLKAGNSMLKLNTSMNGTRVIPLLPLGLNTTQAASPPTLRSKQQPLSCKNKQRRHFDFHMKSPVDKNRFIAKISKLGVGRLASPSNTSPKSQMHSAEALQTESECMTAASALKKCRTLLTDYEQSEILHFKQVFFLGVQNKKLQPNPIEPNQGFDDDKGGYKIIIGDHIAFRYEIIGIIGSGSFGTVVKCFDHKYKEEVAVKVIRNRKNFHKQGAVEVKVLGKLRETDQDDQYNIVKMKNSFVFRQHLVITFELLNINLYEFLKFNRFEGLSMSLARRFTVQILHCLKHLRELDIIHCDLKPENILLRQAHKSGVKVIDFGSSCFRQERIYTYIQSRFYRAPEIILGAGYGTPIDMWSLGCIVAELHIGYPLFPGESEQQQLLRIMEVLGEPPKELMTLATRSSQFFNLDGEPIIVPDSKGKIHTPLTRSLARMVNSHDELFLDFIRRCLTWNPADRITPEAALEHSWIVETTALKDQSRSALSSPKARLNSSKVILLGSPRH